MRFYDDITSLIGKTPLVRINRLTKELGIKAQIYAKMESLNPGYSVKDRIGISMIDHAEQEGVLKPGGTIIEATSGNTGIGLALTAAVRGYKCIFVLTDKVSMEKTRYLRALGADVVVCPNAAKAGTPDHYVETAKRIAKETPNSFYPDQYSHPANPEAHYRTTGPELWEDTDGKITHFVAGIGTGGTISGTGRYLKEKDPNIQIIGADPYGSIFKTYKETGLVPEATPYLVEGIGQCAPTVNADMRVIDRIINVTDRDSFEYARKLGKVEGIFCGGSTGTNFVAAIEVARELDEDAIVVFIVCDTGEHYLTKFHSDEWMKEKLLLEPQKITAGLIAGTKGPKSPSELVFANPGDSVAEALERMDAHGVTQMPVLEDGKPVGALKETAVLGRLVENRDLLEAQVSEIMEESFPILDVDADYEQIRASLKEAPAVLIEDFKRIKSIVTRGDLLDLNR